MSNSLLNSFIISSSGTSVVTVPYDSGAKIIQNEKFLNYINYYKSAARLSLAPDFYDQAMNAVKHIEKGSPLINVKVNDSVLILWDDRIKAFKLLYKSKKVLIDTLSKSVLSELKKAKKLPWNDLFVYLGEDNFSFTKTDLCNEFIDIIQVSNVGTIKDEVINKIIKEESSSKEDVYLAILELIEIKNILNRLQKIKFDGLNAIGNDIKNKKIVSTISFVEGILKQLKFMSIGRFSGITPITEKSFPFTLECVLDFTELSDHILIVKPLDAIRMNKKNVFVSANDKLPDCAVSKFSNDSSLTLPYNVYQKLNVVGQGCREDIFQKGELINSLLWNKIIIEYLDNFDFNESYNETPNLIFFTPDKFYSDIVEGYSLISNTVFEFDQNERIFDRSVLFSFLNNPPKRFDTDFTDEYIVSNSQDKSGLTDKGTFRTFNETLNLGLNRFQKNFLFKSINLLTDVPNKFSSSIITLNAPPGSNKFNVVSSFIASQIVEASYVNIDPEVTFSFTDYNELSSKTFHNLLNENGNRSSIHPLLSRWVYSFSRNGKLSEPVDYTINLDTSGKFSFEYLAFSFISKIDVHIDKYLLCYDEATNRNIITPDMIKVMDLLHKLKVATNENSIDYLDFKLPKTNRIESAVNNLSKVQKHIYELLIFYEAQKREYINYISELIDASRPFVINDEFEVEVSEYLKDEHQYRKKSVEFDEAIELATVEKLNIEKDIDNLRAIFLQLKQKRRDIINDIKHVSSSIRKDIDSLVSDIQQLNSKSALVIGMSGGKKKAIEKLLSKYKKCETYVHYKHIIDQYINLAKIDNADNLLIGAVDSIVSTFKSTTNKNEEVLNFEIKINKIEMEISEKERNLEIFTSEINKLNEDKLFIDEKLIKIENFKKLDEIKVTNHQNKDILVHILEDLYESILPISKHLATRVECSLEILESGRKYDELKYELDYVLTSLVDACFKPLLFNISMRLNEGNFFLQLPTLEKGFTYESIRSRFRIFSYIFPVFCSSPSKIAQHISSISPNGWMSSIGIIDTIIIDNANAFSPEVSMTGLSIAKKALIIGDTAQPGPLHVVSESMDVSLSTKVLDTGYFVTPEIQDNVLNCHKASILSISQFYNPWHPFKDLSRGDYLLDVNSSPIEMYAFSNNEFYKNNLLFSTAPIYYKNRKPKYSSQIGQINLDNASFSFYDNYKLEDESSILPSNSPFHLVLNEGEFNFSEKTNNKEIVSILKWIDDNYSYLTRDGRKLHEVLSVLTPFNNQALKIMKAGLCVTYSNKDLEKLKHEIFNKYSEFCIYSSDFNSNTRLNTDVVIFSTCYDDKHINENNFAERDPTLLNVLMTTPKKSLVVFANRSFVEKIKDSKLNLAKLFNYIDLFQIQEENSEK